MHGKIAIVTGATRGIGREVARGLATKGATVVLAARDEAGARVVRDEIATATGNPNVSVLSLDVSRQASIRAFARTFRATHERLDVLVNNAGAAFDDRRESADGIELTWATNVLGPFLLVQELEASLRSGAPSRIVNITSSAAFGYDPQDVEFTTRKYDGFKAYAQSKQALRMLTWWQAARLAGAGVTANVVAPGFVRTDFLKHSKGLLATLLKLSAPLFAVTPAKGAETALWVATAPELEASTGKLYESMKEKDGKFRDGLDELVGICERMTRVEPAS